MRRIACIALPEIRVEIAREGIGRQDAKAQRSPLVVIVARPGGAVKSERDVLGNTRIDCVSSEAQRWGVRAGHTVAAARAKCAEIRVRVLAEDAVRASLVRVAEAGLALGPAAAFDVTRDVVWIDVTGCAHLHGGEETLARVIEACVVSLGHTCRVAIADGPRIASAVARFARARERRLLVVPEGQGAAAMCALPVEALELDDDMREWLRGLGLRTCGDLQKLPRRGLGLRLGERAHDVMLMLDGVDRAPIDAWRPPTVPEERIELEWGASSTEALAFVAKTLCDRLAVRLAGRAMAAARLEIKLRLDRALWVSVGDRSADAGTSPLVCLEIVLPMPIARAPDLLAVVRARLDRVEIAAPALAVTLRASELARVPSRALVLSSAGRSPSGHAAEWLEPEAKADHALPRLVAELGAELGPSCVGTLALVDTWIPDARTRLVPLGVPREEREKIARAHVPCALEPTRLVSAAAVPLPEKGTRVARVACVHWWNAAFGVMERDLVATWMDSALAWVEVDRAVADETIYRAVANETVDSHPTARLRGWVD
jgi:protein ImuB